MKVVWGEPKRLVNLSKHGMDFATLTVAFFEEGVILPSRQDRFLAIGNLNGEMIVAVVFRPLGSEALAVISMQRASKSERSLP